MSKLLSFRKWLYQEFEMSHERFVQMDDDFKQFVYDRYDLYLKDWSNKK